MSQTCSRVTTSEWTHFVAASHLPNYKEGLGEDQCGVDKGLLAAHCRAVILDLLHNCCCKSALRPGCLPGDKLSSSVDFFMVWELSGRILHALALSEARTFVAVTFYFTQARRNGGKRRYLQYVGCGSLQALRYSRTALRCGVVVAQFSDV